MEEKVLVITKIVIYAEFLMEIENIFSAACYITGAVFLVIALFGAWPHLFTMSICFATGILVSEDKKTTK